MIDRLASRIDGLRDKIRREELTLIEPPAFAENPFADARNVTVQPKRHNAIAAAVALIDEVLADD